MGAVNPLAHVAHEGQVQRLPGNHKSLWVSRTPLSVLPVPKRAQANSSTIEAVTSLVSPQAANIERAGFAVLGVVINASDAAGAAAGANGLNVTLDAQFVADITSIAAAVKAALRGRWPVFFELCREAVKGAYYWVRGWI